MSLVLIDEPAPHVVRVLLNRPDKRNAVDHAMRQALIDAIQYIAVQHKHRAMVFGGVGGVFSAGGDVQTMAGLSEAQARERMQHGHRLTRGFAELEIPVVTAIEGMGVGACLGLALVGDHIVVGSDALIMFPFMKLGLIPDWGILYSLPRRIGLPSARRLLMESATLTGAEAAQTGLADTVVDTADVMAMAITKATEFSRLPIAAFARMKSCLNQRFSSMDEILVSEEINQTQCLLHAEFAEGHAALMQKRRADFVHLGAAA